MRTEENFNILANDDYIIFYRTNVPINLRYIRCYSKDGWYSSAYDKDVPDIISLKMLSKINWLLHTFLGVDRGRLASLLKIEIGEQCPLSDLYNIPLWVSSLIILEELKK